MLEWDKGEGEAHFEVVRLKDAEGVGGCGFRLAAKVEVGAVVSKLSFLRGLDHGVLCGVLPNC